jgi:arylsulfatase A-like enzyme
MKLNILILSIDSLRPDRIFGNDKSAVTPTIDKLIKNGIYFTQAISSADSTGIGLGSFATAKYSFQTGSTQFSIDPNMFTYFQLFKNNGYNTYATVPDHIFFLKLTKNFTDVDPYVYYKRESWLQLVGGIGESIINRIKTKNKEPWLHFIHLMDLHAPFYIPKEFDTENFGKTQYDRMVSSIDSWLGKIIEEIDLTNTLVIVTADHGDYIPIIENWEKPANFHPIFKKLKKTFPMFELLGVKILAKYILFRKNRNAKKFKNRLTEKQYHALLGRGQEALYDDIIRIPLIFSGHHGIPNPKVISQQVRQVDIFPTIADIANVINPDNTINGRSLVPIMNGNILDEIPAYIETGITWLKEPNAKLPKRQGHNIGIRTPDFKYWRSRDAAKKNVVLFDLKHDPQEDKNIADENPSIVIEMEQKLESLKKNSIYKEQNHVLPEEEKLIEEELKKLGYIK